jgi:mannose-1-phosphate guanylyltransferase/mannose-1-phosphate guanylyltransferase/mannose-6-phosphate isomerase
MATVPSLIQPVILSGGSGTRLWPLSREDRPKQFLALTGEKSMLQLTAERVMGLSGFRSPIIVANARHRAEVDRQMAEIGADEIAMILEPLGRNTAPAIALAAMRVEPRDILLVMPSDHVIADVDRFRSAIAAALPLVEQGFLLTFGITPDAPETGYGYIERGAPLGDGIYRVSQFVEKPDAETAAAYLSAGRHSWNAGIFLFQAGDYLAELEKHAPAIVAACRNAIEQGRSEGQSFLPDEGAFTECPSNSVDYAVMEKAANVAVIPLEIGWSDIGSWDALQSFLATTNQQALSNGMIVEIDTEGCFIKTDGPTVAAVGVKDLIIVATATGVLVIPRGQSQKVKDVVEALAAKRV